MANDLTIGSLFSGVGGLELGLEWAGLGPVVWQVEQDPFCRQVLAKHWPGVDRSVCDVGEAGAANLAPVQLICGGFPCQDVSSAGKGAGLAGSRSGLWFEFARVVDEMRPLWVVVENVTSGAKRWVDAVCTGLGQLGYATLPVPLSAEDVGAPYPRQRVFIIAHAEPLNAKVARTSKLGEVATGEQQVTGAFDNSLRKQPRRRSGESREGSLVTTADRVSAGTRSLGRRRQLQARESEATNDNWWSTPPPVDAVVSGFPGRVDHQRALGNSVVPQCAEVIGHMVRLLDERPAA